MGLIVEECSPLDLKEELHTQKEMLRGKPPFKHIKSMKNLFVCTHVMFFGVSSVLVRHDIHNVPANPPLLRKDMKRERVALHESQTCVSWIESGREHSLDHEKSCKKERKSCWRCKEGA